MSTKDKPTHITFTVLKCQRNGRLTLAIKEGDHGHHRLNHNGGPVWDEVENFTVEAKELEQFIEPKLAEEVKSLRKALVRLYQAVNPVKRWFHSRYVDARIKAAVLPVEPDIVKEDHVVLAGEGNHALPVTTSQMKELVLADQFAVEESNKWLMR